MYKGCLQCGAVLAIIIAILSGINPSFRMLIQTVPLYWNMNSATFLEYDGDDNIPKAQFEAVRQTLIPIQSVHSIEEMAKDWDLPYIIRGAVPNCRQILKDTPGGPENTATFFESTIRDHGTCARVGVDYTGESEEIPIQDFIDGTAEIVNKYSSFRSFLTTEQIEAVMPDVMRDVEGMKIKRDTNFVSNFTHDVITATMHAAILIKSWSLQCEGTKRWLLWDAAGNDALKAITMPSLIPGKLSERHVFMSGIKIYTGVMGPGDLMYFPPSWMHVVETAAGPNIMINLRQLAMKDSFRLNPIHTAFALIIRAFDTIKETMEKAGDHFSPIDSRNGLEHRVKTYWRSVFQDKPESEFLKYVFTKMK